MYYIQLIRFYENNNTSIFSREQFVAYLSSETLITASSCGIVTAILTISLHPSSLLTKTAFMCFRFGVSSSESLIVAAILRLLAKQSFPSCKKLCSDRNWLDTEENMLSDVISAFVNSTISVEAFGFVFSQVIKIFKEIRRKGSWYCHKSRALLHAHVFIWHSVKSLF